MMAWMRKPGMLLALQCVLMTGCVANGGREASFMQSIYSDMVLISDARSARESSWDCSGGNADFRPVASGDTLQLAAIPGAGAIRHVYFTVMGPQADKPHYLQDLVLRMYWDGESTPSVEVPFGDFFGQGHGRINYFRSQMIAVNPGAKLETDETTLTVGFNSYFPIPFDNGARLTLTNEGPDTIGAV